MYDAKHDRLNVLIDGFGWVTIPFKEDMFRALWSKYFIARKILAGEETFEDVPLETHGEKTRHFTHTNHTKTASKATNPMVKSTEKILAGEEVVEDFLLNDD